MECIGHHEAVRRAIEKHDEIKPFAPENGQKLKFKVGDKVTYINDYGCTFEDKTITKVMERADDEPLLLRAQVLHRQRLPLDACRRSQFTPRLAPHQSRHHAGAGNGIGNIHQH